ncbi:MAG: diaminopimelate decarboxylase [Verrucomicrobia bacterium]|jgi:diaminopimelate decarboxylase|nr:diaminopimelate decarboxylase [Verrucomicrobiota bacterium]
MSSLPLQHEEAVRLADEFGTPLFVYDEARLREQCERALAFPAPYGLTVRYAMKAAPTAGLLRLFHQQGLHIDASSGFEIDRARAAGIPAENISLSTQELPVDFAEKVREGVAFNACSLEQLRRYGEALPGSEVGVRFNPGLGSGGTNRTNVGGPASSFGIWHESLDLVKEILAEFDLTAVRIHSHIGSGGDPAVWQRVVSLNLRLAASLPTAKILNLGGGFKVGRMPGEPTTDLQKIGQPVVEELRSFAQEHGRELHLEIEPGTFLIANAGLLLARVQDVADTGAEGYRFLKLDAGMTEVLRPSLYGAQHPIEVLQASPTEKREAAVVVGHCCESGDIFTPAPGDPEALAPRALPPAGIGDFVLIGGVGAYCSTMCAAGYNSFPAPPEVLKKRTGGFTLLRKRQLAAQLTANEC